MTASDRTVSEVRSTRLRTLRASGVRGYLVAALGVGFGFAVRSALDPLWGERLPYAAFFLTNLVLLQFVEVGPFIFATLTGFVLSAWFFVAPRHSLLIADRLNQVNAGIYLLLSFVVLYLSQRARRARFEEEAARENLRRNLEDLRESEARYSAVVRNSMDAILLTDLQERILAANPAACRMFGWMEDKLRQMTRSTLAAPEDREGMARAQRGIERPMEMTFVRSDGSTFAGEISTGVFTDRDGRSKCSSIIRDITERKRAEARLEGLHKELVAASRQAGMAEIASNVLHNVGNVLNTVNVSATVVQKAVQGSKTATLAKVVSLVREHQSELAAFLTNDAKGKQLIPFLAATLEQLEKERANISEELEVLRKSVDHIRHIVSQQQSYARRGDVREEVRLSDVVEDALRIYPCDRGADSVQMVRDFDDIPATLTNRHQLLQILVNLLQNARQACEEAQHAKITIRIRATELKRVRIEVADNGVGIPAENLTRIFRHGFTTRKDGHGFGLHSGALAAKEMGGTLVAQSDGVGKGSTFILDLPLAQDSKGREGSVQER